MKKRMHKLAAAAAAVMLLNAIPVTAFAAEEETPTAPKYTLDKDAFRSVLDKNSADIIKFAEPPETATKKGTVGEGVSAYIDSFTDDSDTVQNTLYICADAKNQAVYAPADSSELFAKMGDVSELDCTGLDTGNVTDMNHMFDTVCTNNDRSHGLLGLDLSGFDTSNVTNMNYMFRNCWISGKLDIENFDTSNVTDMMGMFADAFIEEVDLSSLDTENVTNMSKMFMRNERIELDLSGFDTSNVTDMSYMFQYFGDKGTSVAPLNSLDLSSFDTSKVTNMSHMFEYCNIDGDLNILNFDLSNVTDMTDMFDGFKAENVYCYPRERLRYDADGDLEWAAAHCVEPTDEYMLNSDDYWSFVKEHHSDIIKIKFIEPSVKSETDAVIGDKVYAQWEDETGTVYIYSDSPDKKVYAPYESMLFIQIENLEEIDFTNFDTSKCQAFGNMFYECKKLKSLDLSGFDTRNAVEMYRMFVRLSSLESLDVSSFDTSNVTEMTLMFDGLPVSEIDVSGFDTSKVTYMCSMFYGCSNLTALDVSGFDTSKVTDMCGMFSGCASLTSLDVSSFDTSKVMSMRSMFEGCSNLTALDLSGFDTSKVTSMCSMFYNCKSLTALDFSSFDTSKVKDMSFMFSYCHGLTSLNVSSFDTSNVTNMRIMFSGCKGLTSLDLSNFDLTNVTKMENMYKDCEIEQICCTKSDYDRYVAEGGLSLSTKLLAPAVSVSLRGDANCDEIVDISDAILLARYAAEDTTVSLTEIGKQNADVTGDGKLTAEDTAYIIRMIAKLV